MKARTVLYYFGILSVLITVGPIASARVGGATARKSVKDAPRSQGAKEQRLQEATRAIEEQRKASGVELNGEGNIINFDVASRSISSQKARKAVEQLQAKAETTIDTAKIAELIQSNPEVGRSLIKLAEQDNVLTTGDLHVIIKFAVDVAGVSRQVDNANNPVAQNVVLDLAGRLHEISSWESGPRSEALDLMQKFTDARAKQPTIAGAFQVALGERGYNSLPERVKRAKEIRENCRR